MEIKYSGLKCDAEGCSYIDGTVERKDFELSINKPCHNCGGNLLTLEDYFNVLILEEFAEKYKEEDNSDEEMTTVRVNTHKTLKLIEDDGEI